MLAHLGRLIVEFIGRRRRRDADGAPAGPAAMWRRAGAGVVEAVEVPRPEAPDARGSGGALEALESHGASDPFDATRHGAVDVVVRLEAHLAKGFMATLAQATLRAPRELVAQFGPSLPLDRAAPSEAATPVDAAPPDRSAIGVPGWRFERRPASHVTLMRCRPMPPRSVPT
ncbi:MAG: hypothetical protein U0575_11505 [Phycisphaerales bacterium]